MKPIEAFKVVDQIISTQRLTLSVPEFNALKSAMETLAAHLTKSAEEPTHETSA